MTGSTVTLLDHMGSDLSVVNAARVSFGKRSDALTHRDIRLIGYLASHGHWTPFAHPQVSLHIRAPMFVRSQLFKHKVGLTENEISRRYVDDEPRVFSPEKWRARPAGSIKQGAGELLPHDAQAEAFDAAGKAYSAAVVAYRELLAYGVAPEQARIVLPVATFTEWVWTGSLVAFGRVVALRNHPDAQAEAADVARQIDALITPLFPHAWAALRGQASQERA